MRSTRVPFALLGLLGMLAVVVAYSSYPAKASTRPAAAARTAAPNAILRREVFGFVNYSKVADPTVGYPAWDFRLLSTVAFFDIHVQYNGQLVSDSSWTAWNSNATTNLISTAHAYGAKVVVVVRGPSNAADLCDALYNDQTTISQVVSQVQQKGIDGVNIDYEGQLGQCTNIDPTQNTTNQVLMTRFAKDMRAGLDAAKPGYYLSIDTYSGSAEGTGTGAGKVGIFSIPDLNQYVDSFVVMAYDMDWANYNAPPLNCSSYCFNPVSPLNTYQFNVTSSMQEYASLVPSIKIILGQPYYGSRGCVASSSPAHQTLISNYVNTTYIYASTIASQSGVVSLTRHRDPSDGVSEWDTWYDTDWNCWREQYFDDVVSLGAKYDVVNQMNLRGVGLFTLDYGGASPELWTELNDKFATTTPWYTLGGYLTAGPAASSWGATRTDVFVRGVDNAVWHRSFDGTNWTAWDSLGGYITADPTAVSWGPNRIDLFVRGIDHAMWHRSFDGTNWSAWEKLGGYLTSAPEATSWGPNRLDVFVTGTDHNGLWQDTFNGTSWSWTSLGGVATSDPGAVTSAPNHLDVFVRGTDDGQLWQDSWNGTTWSWTPLGGVLTSSPDASSCSAGHLDVFVQGTDGGLWQRGFNGTSWGSWQSMRGQWTASPGAVCPSGATNATVFERGPDGQLWWTSTPGS